MLFYSDVVVDVFNYFTTTKLDEKNEDKLTPEGNKKFKLRREKDTFTTKFSVCVLYQYQVYQYLQYFYTVNSDQKVVSVTSPYVLDINMFYNPPCAEVISNALSCQ